MLARASFVATALLAISFVATTPFTRSAAAQEQTRGKIEIVKTTATKYAWLPESVDYVFDKMQPKEGSALLVVEIQANVIPDERGWLEADVAIESAKGNKRSPVRGLDDAGNLTQETRIDSYTLLKREETNRRIYRFLFIVPSATTDATLVVGETREQIAFPAPPAEPSPLAGGPIAVDVVSTDIVSKVPRFYVDYEDITVKPSQGAPIAIERKDDPAFERYVAVNTIAKPKDPEAVYNGDGYAFGQGDFVAVYEEGVAYRSRTGNVLSGQAGAEGKLGMSSVTFYFPIPPDAKKGTIYFRQQPIAELDVSK